MQKQTLGLVSGDTDPAQEIHVLHSAIMTQEVDSTSKSNERELLSKKLTIDNLIQEEVD